jgi:cytochrome P450
VYNLWFHPLARFPGPTLWTVSRLPYVRSLQRGDFHQVVKGFHDQYGPIVRLASNELSFIDAQAWQDIYAHHRQGKDFLKNTDIWFKPQPNGVHSIISVNDADHSRQRRLLAHAFSNKAFQTHEPILQYYINLMVSRLREKANSLPENTAIVDIVDWINFTTFDITGELSFGESFGCLKAGVYDPWISLFFQTFKAVTLGASTRFIPGMESIFRLMISKAALQKRQDHFKVVQEKVHKRVNREENMQKSDFIIVVAGAETTGTALTGTISYLIQSPESLSRLAAEVREAFKDEADITKDTVNKLPFLTAVIEEGLRLCPPTPAILPRVVPPEGAFVCGHWLPGNVRILTSPILEQTPC